PRDHRWARPHGHRRERALRPRERARLPLDRLRARLALPHRDRRGRARLPARAHLVAATRGRRDRLGRSRCRSVRLMPRLNFGPARVPSRESPEAAVELLLERGYTACEIDFEGKFWMDYPWAERFGELARDNKIVLS